MKKCPYCAEQIQDEAIKCRFCGSMLSGAESRFGSGQPDAADSEIRQVLKDDGKIAAIRLAREKKNLDLKGAKEYVEGLSPVVTAGGQSTTKKSNPAVAVLAALIILGGLAWSSGLLSTTDSSGRFVMPQGITAPAPVVTMAEFNGIRDGMSYEEVVRVIGAAGQLMSQSDIAGNTTVMYSWSNSNGSNMNAMFQNGKLIQKAQFGLP